jgi:general secretion pathway protein L
MAALADSTSLRALAGWRRFARRSGLAGFGEWWVRELGAAMPERLRAALERRRARPVLAFDGATATLWRPAQTNGRVQMREAARIALDGDPQSVASAGRAVLAPLLNLENGRMPPIAVALSPRAALRKTLTLPLALEEHLRQSLAYDLDRHTPFKADELYFDAAVIDRDVARGTLRVDLAAARRALVDTVLRQAEGFGVRVGAVVVDPPAAVPSSRLNLLPADRRVSRPVWARWQVVFPVLLLGAAALAALVLPIWQKREQVIALNGAAEFARQRAAVSEGLRTELERRVSDYNFALERKYAFPGTVQVLEDVTRILPDDTWLTQLELRTMRGKDAQRELALRGESANAGRLVSLLEDSKLFTQTAPRSPTTKIQPGPGEIFDVSAHLKPQPPPVAVPLDMSATPPPRAGAGLPSSAAAPPARPAASAPARAPAPSNTAAGTPGRPAPAAGARQNAVSSGASQKASAAPETPPPPPLAPATVQPPPLQSTPAQNAPGQVAPELAPPPAAPDSDGATEPQGEEGG